MKGGVKKRTVTLVKVTYVFRTPLLREKEGKLSVKRFVSFHQNVCVINNIKQN